MRIRVFKRTFISLLALSGLALFHNKASAEVTPEHLQSAIKSLDTLAQKEVDDNAVVGMSIAVVHKDKVVFAKGYGLRDVNKTEKCDPDTVFQLASCSKPLASTVVAALVGEGKINWDSRISDLDPGFEMYTPWVTHEVTVRDFFAHRSGLPDHAGDLIEDIGYDRAQVLHRLRYQIPSSSFRAGYAYTNFGMTEGGVAAAKAYGLTWEEASAAKLYKPLGMNSTSSRYSDYNSRVDKALGHVKVDGKFVQKYHRQPDAQSPAGGASSSANDMALWIRLQLGAGKVEGKQVVDEKALVETRHPQMLTQFNPFNGLPGFYGLGMNVNYDEYARLRIGHSGAFSDGAATNVLMYPGEDIGVVVLTNTYPVGVAEGLTQSFMDQALDGKLSHDWLAVFKKVFADPATLEIEPGFDFKKAPAKATVAASNSAYVGTYTNDLFGDVVIAEKDGHLQLIQGPNKLTADLSHYDRDVFYYETVGENRIGLGGATFMVAPDGKAENLLIEHLNKNGQGLFKRK